MELNKKNMRKIMLLITFTVILFIGIEKINAIAGTITYIFGLIFPFFLGAVFAFALNVPMRFYEKKMEKYWIKGDKWKKQRRRLSFLLTILTVAGILFVLSFLVIPQITKTVRQLIDNIPHFNNNIEIWTENLSAQIPQLDKVLDIKAINWDSIGDKAITMLQKSLGNMVNSTFGFISSVVSGMVSFFIALVFGCYILFQKEELAVQAKKIVYAFLPAEKADYVLNICRLSDNTFSRFLIGQCTEGVILGTMFVVSMLIFRLPYAMLIGVLIAVLSLIPIVGSFIGCFIGAFLMLMDSPMKAVIFVILFLVLQQIEGNLIYPYVVGNSVGLPSIWVLFAVTVGGRLMGVGGMIIGIPVVSVLYTLFAQYVHYCLKKKHVSSVKWKKIKSKEIKKQEKIKKQNEDGGTGIE